MTAKEIMSPLSIAAAKRGSTSVAADTHIVDTLHRLLDTPDRRLDVMDGDIRIGSITSDSMLEGLASLISQRDDSSLIVVECMPEDYSASLLAHAVEDADTHLVDIWTNPTNDGKLRVTLRVRRSDPTAVVRSLERYDFNIVDTYSSQLSSQTEMAIERMEALNALLNV